MARLTWRDVSAPDYRGAAIGMNQANELLQGALGGLSASLGSFADQRRLDDAAKREQLQQAGQAAALMKMLSNAGDDQATMQGLRSGEYLQNIPTQALTPEFLQGLLNTGLSNAVRDATSMETLGQTRFDNDVTQREEGARQEAQTLVSEILRLEQAGNRAGAERLKAENAGLLANLSLDDQTKVYGAGSSERGAADSLVTSAQNRHINANQEGRAAVNHSDQQFDRTERRNAEGLALGAQTYSSDPLEQINYILSQSNNDVESRLAISNLSTDPRITNLRGDATPDPEMPTSLDTQVATTVSNLTRRTGQEDAVNEYLALDSLSGDRSSALDVSKSLKEKSKDLFGEMTDAQIQHELAKVRETNPGMNWAQAGRVLESSLSPTFIGSDINRQGAAALAGSYGSPAALRAQEGVVEREGVASLIKGQREALSRARQKAQEAQRLARATGNATPVYDAEEEVTRLSSILENTLRTVNGDNRLAPLVVDPARPGEVTTIPGQQAERQIQMKQEAKDKATRDAQRVEARQRLPALEEQLSAAKAELDIARAAGRNVPGGLDTIRRLSDRHIELRKEVERHRKLAK